MLALAFGQQCICKFPGAPIILASESASVWCKPELLRERLTNYKLKIHKTTQGSPSNCKWICTDFQPRCFQLFQCSWSNNSHRWTNRLRLELGWVCYDAESDLPTNIRRCFQVIIAQRMIPPIDYPSYYTASIIPCSWGVEAVAYRRWREQGLGTGL